MKKLIIILSAAACIAGGCRNRQPKTANEVNLTDTLLYGNEIDTVEIRDINTRVVLNGEILFDIQQIDSINYFNSKAKTDMQKTNLKKITDLEQVKDMLKGRVIWGKYDDEKQEMVENEQGEAIYKILFRNGKTNSSDYPEFEFVAYFPQEDVLFIVGEHYSPMICNLTTGEETEEVGDPEYRCYSPSKQYRFNGYYSGQRDVYFIQEKSGTQYKTIIELNQDFELGEHIGFNPEYLADVFWQNDTILNFVAPRYFYEEDKEKKFYYQLILKSK